MSCCGNCKSNATADCGTCSCSGVPTPYYNQNQAVQEYHCMPVVNQVFVTALSIGEAFAMPTCNKYAVITFPGLLTLQIGSYLWSAVYGYLLVTEFDPNSGQARVLNECQTGNATPGTVVPKCSYFNVVDPPCNCQT